MLNERKLPIVAVATIAFFVRIREKSIEVMYAMESCVIHSIRALFEISNIQETLPVMLCDGGSFVDSFPELSATNIALVGLTRGSNPEIVPSSVTKMNIAGLPGATASRYCR